MGVGLEDTVGSIFDLGIEPSLIDVLAQEGIEELSKFKGNQSLMQC